MKVTIIVNGRFHAFDLAEQLQDRGCLSKLITTYPKYKAKEWNIPSNKIVSLAYLEAFKRFAKYLPAIRPAVMRIEKFLFGIIASFYIKSDNDILVVWAGNGIRAIRKAKRYGIKTILERGSTHIKTQNEILITEYTKFSINKKSIPDYYIKKEILEYSIVDYISIPSSFVKRSFIQNGVDEKKLIRVPYGVDLSNFKMCRKEDGVFRVISCGTFSLQKGNHYLLQAISELNLPNLEYWHIGNILPEMKAFIEKYESAKIIFKGSKSQGSLYKYYSQGSVFVMTSIQEGLAMVQLQAMACGLPVISTTNTGAEDIIENGKEGFIIPIRDINAIKEKIIFMYYNQEICRKMGMQAKEKVKNGFSWNDYGEKTIDAYAAILTK